MTRINVLCIGDVVGQPGRDVLAHHLAKIQKEEDIQFTIANIENLAQGKGITKRTYKEMAELNIQAFTGGNHTYDKKESLDDFGYFDRFVRPLNFYKHNPGKGILYCEYENHTIAIVSLIGQVFMGPYNNPFQTISDHLDSIRNVTSTIFVDFHAEATSEKQAMGWFLDGRVSAVFGTHTHVQTNDVRLLPQFTAYHSDLGMVGVRDSILGMERGPLIQRFVNQMPCQIVPAKGNICIFNALKVTIDLETGNAVKAEAIKKEFHD